MYFYGYRQHQSHAFVNKQVAKETRSLHHKQLLVHNSPVNSQKPKAHWIPVNDRHNCVLFYACVYNHVQVYYYIHSLPVWRDRVRR